MNAKIRTRIAPSPTGNLHVGTARAALFNWVYARQTGGVFMLRMEDTDRERSKQEYEDNIKKSLVWLGLQWDEFYRDSDHFDIYAHYTQQLLDTGKAFWCKHTKEELEAEQKQQQANKEAPRHLCEYKQERQAGSGGQEGIIRLAVDPNSQEKIQFNDLIRGEVTFEARLLGDFSIARSIDNPLFHLAVTVDDHENKITHAIRGEDLLSTVPKQMLIRKALGFPDVIYGHMPLLLAPDRSKLSKRYGAVAIQDYKEQGYLPQAMVNYLGMLGFTHPEEKEIFDINELINVFDVSKIHKTGAIFDIKKLDWVNGEYIKKLGIRDLGSGIRPYIEAQGWHIPSEEYFETCVPLMRERLTKLSEVGEFDYFFKDPEYETELLKWKKADLVAAGKSLEEVKKIIMEDDFDPASNGVGLRKKLDALGERLKDRGLVYWPFRVALTGKKFSPDPVDIALCWVVL